MNRHGRTISTQDVIKMLELADVDNDGRVNFKGKLPLAKQIEHISTSDANQSKYKLTAITIITSYWRIKG